MLQIPESVERMEDNMERVEQLFLEALSSELECGTLIDLSREAEELSKEDADDNDCLLYTSRCV